LDRLRSFKVKLGVLVAVTVTLSVLFTWLASILGITPLLAIPVVVVCALVFTQLLARGMTSPLRQMTRAARDMAQGDYSAQIDSSSRDEVGQLAEAFTSMAADLQQTDQMRRDLVANVSHELRTPVAGLRAQLENLVDGVTEPDPAALSVALAETERLSRLVDHLLDLSRLDAGVVSLEVEEIELTPFLHEAADAAEIGALSHRRALRWSIEVTPADLTIRANASRHSPHGGRVRVGAHRSVGDDGVVIEVSDEGPGISRANRERVFERFQRGGSGDGSGGTGLGLAIARWAVELHGGTIEVIDDPARGSDHERSSLLRITLPDRADPTDVP
jgi:signal transduction histidine kinase